MKSCLLFGVLMAVGCQSTAGTESQQVAGKASSDGAEAAKNAGSRSLVAEPKVPTVKEFKTPKPNKWHVPVGPKLGIFRGKGLGPIRFGATPTTVGRHMQVPCKVQALKGAKSLQVCRYPAHAVEYFFEEGVLSQLIVHGRGRRVSADPKIEYGIFNGGFVEGARMGMLIAGVEEFLGKPSSVSPAPSDHPHGAVEIHYYAGAELQFDRSRHGQLLLAGVVLKKVLAKTRP